MLSDKSPFYRKYRHMLHKAYRLNYDLTGIADDGTEVPMPAGSVVEVVNVEQVAEPEYGKIKYSGGTYNGVTDDGVRVSIVLLTRLGARDKRYVTSQGAAASMMDPEPGVVTWPFEFTKQAVAQGWEIFYCEGSAGPLYQLQQVDDEDRFEKDEDAWAFVWRRAVEAEDPLALAALAFLRHRSRKEYETIRAHCLKTEKGG